MPLSPAQLIVLENAAKNDPFGLGFSAFVAAGDYLNLQSCFNFVRDGQTPFPNNGIIGGPSGTITAATNASPIAITTGAPHGLSTGAGVFISGVLGNTAANGTWLITVTGASAFTLNNSIGNGAYTSGGTWNWCVAGVRQQSITAQAMIGSTDNRDWPGSGQATALTNDIMSDLAFLIAICNQPSGQIVLTNPDGTDNKNAKNLKRVLGNTQGSQTAIALLESRTGSYAEFLLGLSGVSVSAADAQAIIASGNA